MFPTYDKWVTRNEVNRMFKHLQNVNVHDRLKFAQYKIYTMPKLQTSYKNKNLMIENNPGDYKNFNTLASYFTDHERMKCSVVGRLSPVNFYKRYKGQIIRDCFVKYQNTLPENIRETMYNMSQYSECTSFRPANLVCIKQMFFKKNITILDPSAGWGDRLVAAISMGDNYIGVDPNHHLHPSYKKIVNYFTSRTKACLINGSFLESGVIKKIKNTARNFKGGIDLAFTSPPYFDLEVYRGKKQSINGRESEEKWTREFLFPYFDNMAMLVNSDGIIALSINQKKDETYVEDLIKHSKNSKSLIYLGVIAYGNSDKRKMQPIFIWQKV
jgi:hypothetical protein